ncbi:MAG: LacI family DNA-binding transcriptional regulator [Acidobacteriota bacterium]
MDILTVARHAGVSTATVSRVLNSSNKVKSSTASRVRASIEKLQYIPNTSARSLRSGKTNVYGLVVSDIRNPFFPDLIEHFESLATSHGIDVTFANTGYSEERLLAGITRLLERNVDGIALLTSEVSQAAIDKLHESAVPVVFLNQPTIGAEFKNITIDYVQGFSDAVEHLRMLGHRKIGFVAGPPNLSSAVRRREAFLTALNARSLPMKSEWLLEGDHKTTGGQFAAEHIFSMQDPPTAVVCSNDMTAIGLLQTAHRLGRNIPGDLSLVGFDDLFLSEIVQPPLTTLHLSRREIATRAFYALHSGNANASASRSSVIQPSLVVRASTASIARSDRESQPRQRRSSRR